MRCFLRTRSRNLRTRPNSESRRSSSGSPARPRRARLSLLLIFSLLFTGCAGYQLGPTTGFPAGSRSVRINLFQNATFEPRLSEAVGTSLRRAIQRDGTYRLATKGGGDVVVDGVLTEFRRSAVTFQPGDIVTVRDYELLLVADVAAIERATGRAILKSQVSGRTVIRAGTDLASAERQAIPLLAEDLARNFTSLLADGTW